MKLLLCPLLLCAAAAATENPQLKQVQSVYILPMGSGMDQYLANKIVRQGLFQVVTDPQKADAILTDRIGEPFEQKLEELYPPPKPEKPKKADAEKDSAANKDDSSKDKLGDDSGLFSHPSSTFGRGKGTFFLVDRKTRAVIWSTYDRASNNRADTLDKKADQVVARMKKDLKESKAGQ